MVLENVLTGQKVKVVSVDDGRELVARLSAMGIIPGTEITVIRNNRFGPFVVAVKGARIMLGRGMANKIFVEE